jgi:hypothetical protein
VHQSQHHVPDDALGTVGCLQAFKAEGMAQIDLDRVELQRVTYESDWQSAELNLLRPYKEKYLEQAVRVRETVTFSWQRGAAYLMDFLNAQSDYRQVQLAYVQLVGFCLTAASELNLAVGSEVIQ